MMALFSVMVHVAYTSPIQMGLLVEVDGPAKLGVQHDLERLHPLFALFCGGGQVGELGGDVGLVFFEPFEGAGEGEMEKRFADLVSVWGVG